MLGCDKIVTFVRYADEVYTCTEISGVSVEAETKISVQDKGFTAAVVTTICIPASVAVDYRPMPGDFVVFGRVAGVISKRADIETYPRALVIGVEDRLCGGIAHLEATCQ